MSRLCQIVKSSKQNGHSIATERSRVTKRTKRFFCLNIQKHSFELDGRYISLKVSNRTRRTIEKYGGLKNTLFSLKRGHLTDFALQMRDDILKKEPEAFKSHNLAVAS